HAVSVVFVVQVLGTPEISALSLHDALPIWRTRCEAHDRLLRRRHRREQRCARADVARCTERLGLRRLDVGMGSGPRFAHGTRLRDRKSTRLNSSHVKNSYAVFCLKKKIILA